MGFVQGELMSQLNFVQQRVRPTKCRRPQLTSEQLVAGAVDENRISTLFYDLPTTSLRRNKLIIPNLIDNKMKVTPLDKVFKAAETKMLKEQMMYPGKRTSYHNFSLGLNHPVSWRCLRHYNQHVDHWRSG